MGSHGVEASGGLVRYYAITHGTQVLTDINTSRVDGRGHPEIRRSEDLSCMSRGF